MNNYDVAFDNVKMLISKARIKCIIKDVNYSWYHNKITMYRFEIYNSNDSVIIESPALILKAKLDSQKFIINNVMYNIDNSVKYLKSRFKKGKVHGSTKRKITKD